MASFIKVAKVADVPDGSGKLVEAGGKQIALFNAGGKFFAIDNTCKHRGGPLADCERGADRTVERFFVETQLLAHHHVAPSIRVRRDVRDDLVEQRPGESLAAIDAADLFALTVGPSADFVALTFDLALIELDLR